ncbi:MAG TPA: serine hydrolase, partial [Candidatus Paceibacterota bacterium]
NQPILSYFTRPLAEKLKVSARAYLVGDLETGEIILSKNEKEELPIASVSKLMTALVATETLPKDTTALVSKGALATEGGNGDLRLGEKIKSGDLLYPLLLQSSNDAAEVLAENLGRGTFIGKMNERAKELLMFQTKYSDPSGLSVGNQSTVSDLFRLARHLFEREKGLLDLTTLRSYGTKAHIWPSNNQFLKKEGYLGGKSGYTEPARQTVVSLFSAPLSENGPRNV